MLALIAKFDGANACMFHMEHASKRWFYRYRFPDSEVEALRDWGRVKEARQEADFFSLSDPNVPVEAQWMHEGGEWQDAVPHEFVEGESRFVVELRSKRDFSQDNVLRVAASVRGWPSVFDLELPKRVLGVGGFERFVVSGKVYLCGPGSVLNEPGEFSHRCDVWSVTNLDSNRQVALRQVERAEPDSLGYKQGVLIKNGRLAESERRALIEWVENQKQEET